MTNTLAILKEEVLSGDTFYTVEWMDEGTKRTDVISKETLFDIVRKSRNLDFELAEGMEDIDLTYIEVFHSLDGGNEIDVYEHVMTIDEDRGLRTAENILKTYVRESSAIKFAHKQRAFKVIVF